MSDRLTESSKPLYRVAVRGIDARDVRLIEIVFRHSRYNRIDYALVDGNGSTLVDILLVNPYEPDGLRALARSRAATRPLPVITIVPAGQRVSGSHAIALDKLPLQLLPTLNRLVRQEFESTTPLPQVMRQRRLPDGVPDAPRRPDATADAVPGPAPQPPEHKRSAVVVEPANPQADPDAEPSTLIFPLTGFGDTRFPPTSFPPMLQPERVPPMSVRVDSAPAPASPATGRPGPIPFPSVGEAVGQPVSVLVVDDSPTVRRQLSRALTRMGVHCVAVGDAAEAMAEMAREHYELALVDVVMPGANGFALTREIRKHHPGTPVIILTSRSTPIDYARGALAGGSSYLVKPVTPARLEAVVLKLLRKSLAIDDLSGVLRTHPPRTNDADLLPPVARVPLRSAPKRGR
ncbi:MAG: response regulator [Burkholderiaceae bacterium]